MGVLKDNRYLTGVAMFKKLCCPVTHQKLRRDGSELISADGKHRYVISSAGIPLLATRSISHNAEKQGAHYDKVAAKYVENLGYPHTVEYSKYLDDKFLARVSYADLVTVAEICCGHGELLTLLKGSDIQGVGVDMSCNMLEFAKSKHAKNSNFLFVQGDATKLPLQDSQFSSVFMLGGIHHVPDREALFSEVFRILKPGGRFYFREPVSDFFLWRWLRSIIYTVSPALDSETERPLIWEETVPLLEKSGFGLKIWETYGFLGFCLFMNSDVLVFNRAFRFIPGIRLITKLAAYVDDLTVKIPGFSRAGLQVIGVAEKPQVVPS